MRFISLLFTSMLSLKVMAATPTSDLALIISGFETNNGFAMVALVNSREAFEAYSDGPKPFRNASIEIKNSKATYVFKSLPFGEYAIKVFQDENGNQDLDTGLLGIPNESYGFSNDASGTFGPPDYDEAKFLVKSGKQNIHIEMQ